MAIQPWQQFIDHFVQSINPLVPLHSFFAYCIDLPSPPTCELHYAKNLSAHAIDHYTQHMFRHDPLYLIPSKQPQHIRLLSQQQLSRHYIDFLNHNQVLDNIELLFTAHKQPFLGLSLIRHTHERPFSDQEIQIIKTCYGLAQLNAQDYVDECSLHRVLPQHITQHLTRTEQTILQLILTGKKNQDIANSLYISLATVKTHLTHIFQKTMMKNKRELIIHTLSNNHPRFSAE